MTTLQRVSSIGTVSDPYRSMPSLSPRAFFDGLAQTDPQIFDQMMVIDRRVALSPDSQVKKPVACKEIQHMIEKWNARIDLGLSRPVQTDLQQDIRFRRFPFDLSCPHE